jgi:hypothetical protein
MQGNIFTIPVHLHGTLAANAQGQFSLPCDCSLLQVSLAGTNASDAILDCGPAADPDGILADAAIGDSEVPNVLDYNEFNGALIDTNNYQPYHMTKGTVFEWLLDFDGSSGTAAANVGILFVFTEG